MSHFQDCDVLTNDSTTLQPNVDWPELLNRVQQSQAGAADELYALISKGMLFLLRRQMPLDLAAERMHDAFNMVLQAIHDGSIEDPRTFPSYVRTIIKRQCRKQFRTAVNVSSGELVTGDFPSNVKKHVGFEAQERTAFFAEVLRSMRPDSREILIRFYLLEQSHTQICAEMGLTETEFRLLKVRAKVQFAERGRKGLALRKPCTSENALSTLSADGTVKIASV